MTDPVDFRKRKPTLPVPYACWDTFCHRDAAAASRQCRESSVPGALGLRLRLVRSLSTYHTTKLVLLVLPRAPDNLKRGQPGPFRVAFALRVVALSPLWCWRPASLR